MRFLIKVYGLLFLLCFSTSCKEKKQLVNNTRTEKSEQPNVIIIFTDDQGYEDLGVYGSTKIKTPHLDALAKDGIQFTNFYVSASVCSASRAALLTGRYPYKNGVGGVFFPDNKGMDSKEVTLAESLKTVGYKTACFGKWHLGDLNDNLPTAQGFDTYYGIPYSNDMYIGYTHEFADNVVFNKGYNLEKAKADQEFVKAHKTERKKIKEKGLRDLCPLFEDKKIVEYPCEQSTLTQRYFDKAKDFIDAAAKEEKPFFVYLTPAMPHVPLFASEGFKGKSERGIYGDVIEEIDWHTGDLLKHLKHKGLDENTIIIYASDNGPWLSYKDHAGSAGKLRDGKFTNYEGGVRVPCIMSWPKTWEAGVVDSTVVTTLDLLPTITHYAKSNVSTLDLDGKNIATHLESIKEVVVRDYKLYFKGKEIYGIRKGNWKYMPHSGARHADKSSKPELFNLKDDISESKNVINEYPLVVEELSRLIEEHR